MSPADDRRDASGRQRGAARSQGRTQRSAAAPSQRRRGSDPAADRGLRRPALPSTAPTRTPTSCSRPCCASAGSRGRDAGFATELAYGTLRLRGRYDAVIALAAGRDVSSIDPPALDVLRLGAHQLLGMRVPAHAAVSETVGLAREQRGRRRRRSSSTPCCGRSGGPREEWLAPSARRAGRTPARRGSRSSRAIPLWVVRALREALVRQRTVRRRDRRAARRRQRRPARHARRAPRPGRRRRGPGRRAATRAPVRSRPTAVVLSGGDPAALAGVRDGRAGVQDEGSQLVTLALHAGAPGRAGRAVARPVRRARRQGGAARRRSRRERGAPLVANEVQPHRARLVEQALRRCRAGRGRGRPDAATAARSATDEPRRVRPRPRRRAVHRSRRAAPTARGALAADAGGPRRLTALQRDLLASALGAVRPGGVVAYVTCSPHLAETQLVVEDVRAASAGVDVGRSTRRRCVRGIVARRCGGRSRHRHGRPAVAARARHGRDAPDAAAPHQLSPGPRLAACLR